MKYYFWLGEYAEEVHVFEYLVKHFPPIRGIKLSLEQLLS